MKRTDSYVVALPDFEGPLDLLLNLIERRELEVTALSIGKVTGDYLAALTTLDDTPSEELRWFIDIGSRLVDFKTRALRNEHTASENEDSLEDLTYQVARYQAWRETTQLLSGYMGAPLERRTTNTANHQHLQPPANLTLDNLLRAWKRVRAPKRAVTVRKHSVRVTRAQLHQTMQKLLRNVGSQTSLQQHFALPSRRERALSLLAMLELIKEDLVELFFEENAAYVKAV